MKKITAFFLAAIFAATLSSCEKSRPDTTTGTADPVTGATKKRTTNILGQPIDPGCRMIDYTEPGEDITFSYDSYNNLSVMRDIFDGEPSALKFYYDNMGNLVKMEDSALETYTFVYPPGSNRASSMKYHDLFSSADDFTMNIFYPSDNKVITTITDGSYSLDSVTVDFNSNNDPVRLQMKTSDPNTGEIYSSYVVTTTLAASASINPFYGSGMADYFIENMLELGALIPEACHYQPATLSYLDLLDPSLTSTSTLTNLIKNDKNYATGYQYVSTGAADYYTNGGFDNSIRYACP